MAVKRASQLNEFHPTWQRERRTWLRVLFEDTLPFVNEWVWSKVRSNGTVFSLCLENKDELKKVANSSDLNRRTL